MNSEQVDAMVSLAHGSLGVPALCRSRSEADGYFARHFDPVWRSLTPTQKSLLAFYATFQGFRLINDYLRRGPQANEEALRASVGSLVGEDRAAQIIASLPRECRLSTAEATMFGILFYTESLPGPLPTWVARGHKAWRTQGAEAEQVVGGWLQALDKAVEAGRFGEAVVAWRGLRLSRAEQPELLEGITTPGYVITHAGYSSISLLRERGEVHANIGGTDVTGALLRVAIPAGSRGMTASRFEDFEVILPRDSRLQVCRARKRAGRFECECVLL
jgi:hypothetical protein